MSLTEVAIHHLRNIEIARFELSPELNLFFGENGSGKTSILEGVYLLGTGGSFRTTVHKNLIKDGEKSCTVFGTIRHAGVSKGYSIGVSKGANGSEYRVNGASVKHRAELARLLPLLVVTPSSHQLLDAGPHWRRRYLDWGVFHVEHSFGQTWGMFKRGLQQRNRLLANGLQGRRDAEVLRSIDAELGRLGDSINSLRQSYFDLLQPVLRSTMGALLEFTDFELQLKSGTPPGLCFSEYLEKGLQQDQRRGRTLYGPHTADLLVKLGRFEAKEVLSRGQQKLLVYALLLAQIMLFRQQTGGNTVLALDDVSSELDSERLAQLVGLLKEQQSQLLITGVRKEDFELGQFSNCSMFHVKHGTVNLI